MPELALTRRCQNGWALQHYFINAASGRPSPARCKLWSCSYCAPLNVFKIGLLAEVGNPERLITLTRAPSEKGALSLSLAHTIQTLRRQNFRFEYLAVPELHKNGYPHLHILQRGDFIPQAVLSEAWKVATSKFFQGYPSYIVDVRKVEQTDDALHYITKYLTKGAHDSGVKGWEALQRRYPGIRHYRRSRAWGSLPPSPDKWILAHQTRVEELMQAVRTGAIAAADTETYLALMHGEPFTPKNCDNGKE